MTHQKRVIGLKTFSRVLPLLRCWITLLKCRCNHNNNRSITIISMGKKLTKKGGGDCLNTAPTSKRQKQDEGQPTTDHRRVYIPREVRSRTGCPVSLFPWKLPQYTITNMFSSSCHRLLPPKDLRLLGHLLQQRIRKKTHRIHLYRPPWLRMTLMHRPPVVVYVFLRF